MKHDFELKLQAWLDGEMPADEAVRFNQAIQSDPQARDLLAELTAIKTAMTGNELAVKAPVTRDFYWSQIERQIQREPHASAQPASPFQTLVAQWRRIMVPLVGTAAVVALLLVSVKQTISTPVFSEITFTSSEMEAVTFQDQASKLTVVWLQPKNRSSENAAIEDYDPSVIP